MGCNLLDHWIWHWVFFRGQWRAPRMTVFGVLQEKNASSTWNSFLTHFLFHNKMSIILSQWENIKLTKAIMYSNTYSHQCIINGKNYANKLSSILHHQGYYKHYKKCPIYHSKLGSFLVLYNIWWTWTFYYFLTWVDAKNPFSWLLMKVFPKA